MILGTHSHEERYPVLLAGSKVTLACSLGATTVELAFDSKRLRDVCEMEATANDALGADTARLLRNRLADLKAADTPKDLVAGKPHVIEEQGQQVMSVELSSGHQLIFSPNHVTCPLDGDGLVDWGRVSRIKILRVQGEAHDR